MELIVSRDISCNFECSCCWLQSLKTPLGFIPGYLASIQFTKNHFESLLTKLTQSHTTMVHDHNLRKQLLIGNSAPLYRELILTPTRYNQVQGNTEQDKSNFYERETMKSMELMFQKSNVGHIIGRKGLVIENFRLVSGARISVFKLAKTWNGKAFPINSQEITHLITISGTENQVLSAYSLISDLMYQKSISLHILRTSYHTAPDISKVSARARPSFTQRYPVSNHRNSAPNYPISPSKLP